MWSRQSSSERLSPVSGVIQDVGGNGGPGQLWRAALMPLFECVVFGVPATSDDAMFLE